MLTEVRPSDHDAEVKKLNPLIVHLVELARRADRGTLAALRRCLADERAMDALRVALPFCGHNAHRAKQDAYALVAALFGLMPEQGERTLPAALQSLTTTSESVELRFRAMLGASAEDLPVHLRHAVSLLASHGLAFDWDDVLTTVQFWDHDSNRSKRDWAREFWTPVAQASEANSQPADTND
jgi:CRISPR system Cascade subunit CasB